MQSQPPYIALSDFGKIVNNEWLKSFEIRNELFLDEYIIMPNHLHAIVVLDIPKYNRYNHFFQPNYHDHIIRNDTEHLRIKHYIISNPLKWCDDKFNSSNKNIVE